MMFSKLDIFCTVSGRILEEINEKLVEFWRTFLKHIGSDNPHFAGSSVWAGVSFHDMSEKTHFIEPYAGTTFANLTFTHSLWRTLIKHLNSV